MGPRYALLLLAVMASLSPVIAQEDQLRFRQLGVSEGLSHNHVTCFFKDSKGYIWIGTASGLNRYDGYSVTVFANDPGDSTSIPHNTIIRIFDGPGGYMGVLTSAGLSLYSSATETFLNNRETVYRILDIPGGSVRDVVTDDQGNCWILHTSGLFMLDPIQGATLPVRRDPNDSSAVAAGIITSVANDRRGGTWMMYEDGMLERIIIRNGNYNVSYRNNVLQQRNHSQNYDYRMLADFDGDLWIHPMNDAQGVYLFNTSINEFRQFTRESEKLQLNTNIVTAIVQDDEGMMWIGTDHGGINLINKKDLTVRYIYHDIENDRSLSQNSIISLYKDNEGIIWVGTFKRGLSYHHKNIIRFPVFKHFLQDPNSLPFSDVNRFVEDARGNLWIGTNGGGLIYFDRQKGKFKQFRNNPANPESISSDVIVSLFLDSQGTLWIGTYYGGLNSFDGERFTRYNHDSDNPKSLSDRNVWEIFEDSEKRLWIGTIGGGLDLFDRNTGTFSHYRNGDINSVTSNYISAITEDKDGNLWVGTGAGISVLMRETGRFVHYRQDAANPGSISSGNIFDIRQDSRGRIWIGTEAGLNLFDEATGTFRVFKEPDGLPHNSILTILEGNSNDLWMGTPNGISNMIIDESSPGWAFTFKNYDEPDGLQGKQFNENAALRTGRGELLFGGPNGFNLFLPGQIGLNANPPNVILSDFQLFNKSVHGGEAVDGWIIIDKAIAEATEVVLPPNKNVFSLEFAALNFFHPEKNQYKYKLEGFDEDWTLADSRSRKVTYTNLDPDVYVFRVKASNHDGYWNEKGVSLKITVLPPFWKTRTAFLLYFLIVIAGLLLARRLIQQREQMKYAIEAERKEAMRMHELDMMKIRFFTNVSHEFRTPLTLILTPLDKILKQIADKPVHGQLTLIQRNAKRLLNLVNQLLDFRKLETQDVRFNPCEGDIIAFIRETVYSFSDLSEKKDISLSLTTEVPALETIFDQDKLEKILFNLLSNAFKFTPEHGAVSVNVAMEEAGSKKWLIFSVADTGIGIAADKLDRIFERFFQSDTPASLVNQGSGIGLSITKEFTRIHGGTITATSEPGKGSCFVVKLPVSAVVAASPVVTHEVLSFEESNSRIIAAHTGNSRPRKPVLLLVEDNEDFRFYLKDNLRLEFTVIEAGNGDDGLKQALKHVPDLVVSDIMMPGMDGVELCKRIKEDRHTARIPVILLTARVADEQKLQGYDAGADDYISKPFNFEILASRIRNLIALRAKEVKASLQQVEVKASELSILPLDEKFVQDAIKCVEDNVSSPDFSVEQLSHLLGMSRANLYKKIVTLTSKSPLEFIRTIRLQQAAQLLEKSQLTVAEVAYRVGFNNPKYFARYFRDEYKVLPSVYASEKRKGAGTW